MMTVNLISLLDTNFPSIKYYLRFPEEKLTDTKSGLILSRNFLTVNSFPSFLSAFKAKYRAGAKGTATNTAKEKRKKYTHFQKPHCFTAVYRQHYFNYFQSCYRT